MFSRCASSSASPSAAAPREPAGHPERVLLPARRRRRRHGRGRHGVLVRRRRRRLPGDDRRRVGGPLPLRADPQPGSHHGEAKCFIPFDVHGSFIECLLTLAEPRLSPPRESLCTWMRKLGCFACLTCPLGPAWPLLNDLYRAFYTPVLPF